MLVLDDTERAMLAGEQGEACALAMGSSARWPAARATRLLEIGGAHIDGCVDDGLVRRDWALRFRDLRSRVRVPTTPNFGLLELLHPGLRDV
jgi:predicted aconitase